MGRGLQFVAPGAEPKSTSIARTRVGANRHKPSVAAIPLKTSINRTEAHRISFTVVVVLCRAPNSAYLFCRQVVKGATRPNRMPHKKAIFHTHPGNAIQHAAGKNSRGQAPAAPRSLHPRTASNPSPDCEAKPIRPFVFNKSVVRKTAEANFRPRSNDSGPRSGAAGSSRQSGRAPQAIAFNSNRLGFDRSKCSGLPSLNSLPSS